MSKFPIGFWNYQSVNSMSAADVKDWDELGMSYAISPIFSEGADKERMISILDECEKRDIKVIMSDNRARFNGASDNPEEYEKSFRKAYEDFGNHPAVDGFHVGDEPNNEKSMQDAVTEYNIHKKVAPNLTPHLNFLPYFKGIEDIVLKFPTFADWAKDFADKTGIDLFCYDCYAQMNPGTEGFDTYFENLRLYSEAAHQIGAKPWTTLLSVGHFRYRVPNEDEFRWQLNTAVASGMKGILWFFMYQGAPGANYRMAPINEFGERTETYTRLSHVNRQFQHQFGGFFNEAEHIATYHTVKSYGGYPMFEPNKTDDILLDVSCEQNLPAIVSFFKLEGHKYVVICNNTTDENGLYYLHLPITAKPIERFNWDRGFNQVKYVHWDARYIETETEQIAGDWLAPGHMKLYKID